VFEFDPATQKLTTLYIFNGMSPYAGLAFDTKGNLYGTTESKVVDSSAVFELTPPVNGNTPWAYSTLATFNEANGNAESRLVLDKNGNIYGTTGLGGHPNCNCGTVYRLDADTWQLSTLYTFTGGADGGNPQRCGVVFKLTPPATAKTVWTETVIHAFTGGVDGGVPSGGAFDPKGALYGATVFGGDLAVCSNNRGFLDLPANPPPGCGAVFRLIQGIEK
jgi:uncharacterized repeat protein (TIGR03803 family)